MAEPTASTNSPPDLDTLSESQRSALERYTSVTAQGISEAIPLLERSQWNVEIAIHKFLDGEGPDPVAQALQEQESARAAAAAASAAAAARPARPNGDRRVNPSLPPAPRIVPQADAIIQRPPLPIQVLLFPFSLLVRLSGSVIALFYTLFPFLPRFRQTPTVRRSQNPRDTAARFIRSFEEEYGTESGLKWHEGGYASALDLAKSDLRFLLVVLQSPEHDDTSTFNRTTLTNSTVVEFLNNNNILLWGGSVQDSEAYQVSTALNCTKFPFAALITHTSNGMSVVARIAGPTPPDAFVRKLESAIAAHTPTLQRIRSTRAEQVAARAIRDQTNAAYQASLAADRARARERREAEERARRGAEEAQRRQEVIEMVDRKREQWRRWRNRGLVQKEDPKGVRVQIRKEEGRTVRKFAADTSMEEVYAWVECMDVEDTAAGPVDEPKDYTHEYGFKLAGVMPRVVYEPDQRTVGELLGGGGGTLMVEMDDDSDEEDDEE